MVWLFGSIVWWLLFGSIVWLGTIVLTIMMAVKKGYSGVMAFFLGLFIPLLGSLIIILLLPDHNILYSCVSNSTPKKKCTKCGKEVNEDYNVCPYCANPTFC